MASNMLTRGRRPLLARTCLNYREFPALPLTVRTNEPPPRPSGVRWHAPPMMGDTSSQLFLQHSHQHQQTRTAVFVSRHNNLEISQHMIVQQFANANVAMHDARTTSTHVVPRECPFCHDTKNQTSNQYKMYVQMGSGAYFCHRCGAKGSWFDLKLALQARSRGGRPTAGFVLGGGPTSYQGRAPAAGGSNGEYYSGTSSSDRTSHRSSTAPLPMPSHRLQAVYSSNLLDHNDNAPLQYLTQTRKLERRTLRKYGVGRGTYQFRNDNNEWQKAECVTFPWLQSVADIQTQEELRGATFAWEPPAVQPVANSGEESTDSVVKTLTSTTSTRMSESDLQVLRESTYLTRRIKVRALESKNWQRLDPPGGGWGLFGFHTVHKGSQRDDDGERKPREIVLTEGEYDAMSVWQATGRPAVSLPNGCRSLPHEVLPLLEDFDKIYLWMDNDGPGQEGAALFARKIGLERCYHVRPTGPDAPKDANEALQRGLDLEQYILAAQRTPHERILTFATLRDDVLHEMLHPEKYIGVPLPSLPKFTSLIQGLRRGELTVMTGPTGSGKTTFLGQLSLDLAEQGVNMLWGSFEIKNTRLMHKLLQQFSREPLPTGAAANIDQLQGVADRFQRLPLYFLKFHGGSDVDDVLDAMDYAVYVNDVEHIILDNMQFMISRSLHTKSTFDKFDVQDLAVEKFRKFATDRNVHVTLVVHPRKEQDQTSLTLSSFYGSAKATQEADTVLILQNEGNKKFLDVKKNRFNGNLGRAQIFFDRKSNRYTEVQLVNGMTVHDATDAAPACDAYDAAAHSGPSHVRLSSAVEQSLRRTKELLNGGHAGPNGLPR